MKNLHKRALGRLILLILTLSILLSSLCSCDLFSYVADGKTEIENNIANSTDPHYEYVSEYLRDWGFPIFDSTKVRYFESCFLQLYNYSDMPGPYDHAKATAELFLEYYYDQIDLSDKTAVTDALLDCYTGALDDPYSVYRPPVDTEDYMTDMSGKFGGIGVIVEYTEDDQIIINTVYPGSPAEKAGIMVGDLIYAIDGMTVEQIGVDYAINYVRGEIGTPVELTLLRDGEYVTLTAIRDTVEEINADYYIDEENNVGYVQIVSFKLNTFEQFKECIDTLEAAGVKGIIIDLRNNTGGYVSSAVDIASYILPDGLVAMSYQYKGRDETFLYTEDEGEDHVITVPIVLLCNQYSASSSEILISALRDHRDNGVLDLTIVGTNTFKKGIMQNTYYYPLDDSTVTLTVAYYKPPCGVNFHGVGIAPDIEVQITDKYVDSQLERGFEELLNRINDK